MCINVCVLSGCVGATGLIHLASVADDKRLLVYAVA